MISHTLRPYLDDLEARIDPREEERLLQEWIAFSAGRFSGPIFSPRRSAPCPPRIEWPRIRVNAALADFDALALQQLGGCSALLAEGSGLLLNARCNYGSSILPSLFGVEPFIMDEALDTLPTSRPLNDIAAIRRLVERGIPDLHAGWGARVLEMGRRYAEIASEYPNIGRWVFIYHPDLQGPLDTCEVLWGASMFYALYDQPGLVHALLELVTETYISFMRAWQQIIPQPAQGSAHWGFHHRGTLMLRDDSAMNLSARMFADFVQPYDQRLLDGFGGGAIHFCGRGDHYIARMSEMHGLHAINLSQPELNDMETIFTHTIDRGINLLGLPRAAAEAALACGRNLRGRVHCS
jgi:hypothetical protein